MGPSLVIVADDLTGAADCGIACAAAGLRAVVAFGNLERAARLGDDAIAFDTDTRRAAPERAAALTAAAVHRLCAGGGTRVLYKKIDSTLRGNFAHEIAAARRAAAGSPLAIVAPAFPNTGRTTRGGRMFLKGTPLEKSEVWRNEALTGIADVPAMLGAAGLPACSVPLEAIRAGRESLAAILDAVDARAVVADAETDADLRALAEAAARVSRPVIFAGSAGLARFLPEAFGLARPGGGGAPLAKIGSNRPLLFVVGSMSGVSREGWRTLAAEDSVQALTLPPATLRGGAGSTAWEEAGRALAAALDGGADAALALGLDEGADLAESAALSLAMAGFLLPHRSRLGGLFLTGGETARALFNAAGVAGLQLVGEVEPGVPLATVAAGDTPWHGLPVVTKAGAFGDAHTLVRCRAALRQLA